MKLHVHYFHAGSSRAYEATLLLLDEYIVLEIEGKKTSYEKEEVDFSVRIGESARYIYFPNNAKAECSDNDSIDAYLKKQQNQKGAFFVNALKKSPLAVMLSIIGIFIASAFFFGYGSPILASLGASLTPKEIEQNLGKHIYSVLQEEGLLQNSQTAQSKQQRLQEGFEILRKQSAVDATLHFHKSSLGANAFALPSGDIIMTDALIKLGKNDKELLAVLAHELGHVKLQHSLKGLYQNSLSLLFTTFLTGGGADATGVSVGAFLPMLYTYYSRDFEREADAFASELLKQQNIQKRHFIAILKRLERSQQTSAIPAFLSTHPATKERIQNLSH